MAATIVGPNVVIGQSITQPNLPIGNGATYFVAGMTERGVTNAAVPLTSMADYAKFLGLQVSYGYLYNDLTAYFAEGGQLAYVARVVGASSTAGSLILNDTNASATLEILANSVGEWSGGLTVEVVNNGVSPGPGGLPNTFSIYFRGIDQPSTSTIVESYLNLTSPAQAASLITTISNYVSVINLGSLSVAPANNPATRNGGTVGTGAALSTGYSNTAGVTTQSYLNQASTLFTPDLGDGVCAIPGQIGTNISQIVPINALNFRTTILVAAQASTNTAAESIVATLKASTGSAEHAGMFWPWVLAPGGNGGTVTQPPDGFIAGVRARNFLQNGAWQASFGVTFGAAQYIVGTETDINPVTPALVQEVYGTGINPIRILGGTPVLYGWQTLSSNPNYIWLNAADLLDRLSYAISQLLEQYVGQPIDAKGVLFSEIAATIQSLLDPITQAGGLYPTFDSSGNQLDNGYAINVSGSINTVQNLSIGTVTAQVGIRMSPAAQLINVTVTKTGFTAAV